MTTPALQRFTFTVAYDGTAYSGWQVQPRCPSVQQTLEETLATITGHPVKIHGSGRTDQGVHACGQVAHADLMTRLDAKSLLRACNARLPADIRIRAAVQARADFHARRSATRKEYRYFVWNDAVMPPERRLYAAHVPHPLDVVRMRDAARAFVGKHDFASFTANPNREVESTVREIFAFTVTARGHAITFRVCGNGFLYKQVRSMVGFLLRVGAGAETPEAAGALLDARASRTARVPSAVPQGLFLWRVWYR
jgi:tRNA pseudouridine38-40 synthase